MKKESVRKNLILISFRIHCRNIYNIFKFLTLIILVGIYSIREDIFVPNTPLLQHSIYANGKQRHEAMII
jgi:hypothetical protein